MSSFLATSSIETDASDPATIIENDGWFPDIDLVDMREAVRLDGTVTDARLKLAVIDAIIAVNRALDAWQKQQESAGHLKLVDVPCKKVAGQSIYLSHYIRAVYSTAKADLTERYRDFDTTIDGSKKVELLDPAIEEQRRNAHWAISDIIGRNHTTVELI